MRFPDPPQVGHGRLNENTPWLSSTKPVPLQAEHETGEVPGSVIEPWQRSHCTSVVTLTVVVTPLTAWSNVRRNSAVTSSPRVAPVVRWPAPPGLPRLNSPPKMSLRSSKRKLPEDPGPPPAPAKGFP